MALPITSIALFSGVVLVSGALTISGLNFTADTVARVAAETPIQTRMKPSYVARLPQATPDDFNVAKSVPVKPVTVATAPIAKLPEASAAAAAAAEPKFTHQVAVDSARVRSGPKKTFPQVFTLKDGNWVNIGETVRGWVRVTDEKGREGWIFGGLIKPAQQDKAVAQAQ